MAKVPSEIHLRKKDFKVEWFSPGKKGGQHANKHANACRISHTAPDGVTLRAQCTSHKERPANQRGAFNLLAARVIAHYQRNGLVKPKNLEMVQQKNLEKVRTYHEPRNKVIDHASGLEKSYSEVVRKGEISDMIDARKHAKLGDM